MIKNQVLGVAPGEETTVELRSASPDAAICFFIEFSTADFVTADPVDVRADKTNTENETGRTTVPVKRPALQSRLAPDLRVVCDQRLDTGDPSPPFSLGQCPSAKK